MNRKSFKSLSTPLTLLMFSLLATFCKSPVDTPLSPSENILINQVGYTPKINNKAVVKSFTGKYSIINTKSGAIADKGVAKGLGTWKHSGETYSEIDLSNLTDDGMYRISLNNGEQSHPIIFTQNYPKELCRAALRSFYFNRASTSIDEIHGGKWARKSGHPDTNVIVHSSATNSVLKPGSIISSPGGWYDAGDYNKYIVNSGVTVYTLLLAYESYPDVFSSIHLNIPESNSDIPDILSEILYNVRWMLSMQDKDGGLYHKLTTLRFEDFVMPEDALKQRYVVMKTSAASLDFAASMAACSRIISKINGLEALADSCELAATKAWQWAQGQADIFYTQPEDIVTGAYPDTNLTDERMWASVEMYLLTGDKKYFNEESFFSADFPFTTPSWDLVNTFGLIGILEHPQLFNKGTNDKAKTEFFKLVDKLAESYNSSPALVSLDYFKWGSNSDVANQAMLFFVAYKNSKQKQYAEMAFGNIDYILGKNPTGYCFITGFGAKSPVNIHHRPSIADNIPEPVPGMIIGGPNTIVLNDCGDTIKRSEYPALSYVDMDCSYSTNEIAINWTAPFIFATGGMVHFIESSH